jgi:hypothetical protein
MPFRSFDPARIVLLVPASVACPWLVHLDA